MAVPAPDRNCVFGILEEEGRILVIANWRGFVRGRVLCWDVPGGGVEVGESLEAACVREFREETGLSVRVRDLAFLVERLGFRSPDPLDRSRYFFFHVERAEESRGRPVVPVDPDIVDHAFCRPDQLRALCREAYQEEFHRWIEAGREPRYFLDPGRLREL